MAEVHKFVLEDGRRAERRIVENIDDCEGEKITELYAEAERPLVLSERVKEKTKPFVYERTYESLDANGNVVEQKVESLDPQSKMNVQSHITSLSAQEEPVKDRFVTSEELLETVKTLTEKICGPVTDTYQGEQSAYKDVSELSAQQSIKTMAAEIKSEEETYDLFDKLCIGGSVVLAGALIYVNFFA